ncbi:hypothetical protein ASA1KI_21240 [Opitutales bacterium ASA1]|uniref:phage protein Gp36 family protein n=1 Tax=Congregicoccus parvus TaxID=3081749 RepID=UPI002B31F511|nr:hypothetical protein ASA1KI_21240 [Opitutales bacterium ASA1]
MPDYTTMTEMNALIPSAFLVQALDDDRDGVADASAWADVLRAASDEINGVLGTKYPVPFANPVPALVLDAARVFCAELLYNRRGFSGEEKNPWAARAAAIRKTLQAIAKGDLPLTAETKRTKPSGSIISETAKTTSAAGRVMA